MKIQCIHFDLDSVLYLPSAFLESALNLSVKMMVDFGLRATHDEALAQLLEIRCEDSNAGDHFDRLCRCFNGCSDPMIIAAGVEKYWDCKFSSMMPAPHAHYVLGLLLQRCPLTIITNGLPVKQAGKIIRIGISHYFTHYELGSGCRARYFYASAGMKEMKPHPYLWKKAWKDIGFLFADAVMVGDRYWTDILGAKRLGMTTVKINQGEHAVETIDEAYQKNRHQLGSLFKKEPAEDEIKELMTPDYTIDNLGELLAVIDNMELS